MSGQDERGRAQRPDRLFVSHNLDAVARLCTTSMWLDKGRVHEIGPTEQIVVDYMRSRRRQAVGSYSS